MKTVFKVGMEVYDQFNFPDVKGVVIEINESNEFSVKVLFDGDNNNYTYTEDGRFRLKDIQTLSTKPYQIVFQGFEQKEPKPTYEDAVKWVFKNNKDAIDNIVGFYINKEHQEAEKALRKLIILRDYYNKGYQFEWLKNEYCAIVVRKFEDEYELDVKCIKNEQRVLFFKSREVANKFFDEQEELLEIAKPLL